MSKKKRQRGRRDLTAADYIKLKDERNLAELKQKTRYQLNLTVNQETYDYISEMASFKQETKSQYLNDLIQDYSNPSLVYSLNKTNKKLLDKAELTSVELTKLQFLVDLAAAKFDIKPGDKTLNDLI